MKIGINCGHTVSGQPGCGAVGFINESDETRKVGYKLMEYLKSAGHTVVNCTNDKAASTNENLSKIVAMANAQPLDLFVSIHFNSGRGKGTEVYTYGGKEHAEALNILKNMSKLGFTNRGVKDGSSLYVVKRTNAKAMLIEVCFVDTKSDVELYEQRGANAVAKAICNAITGEEVKTEQSVFYDVSTNDAAYQHIKKLKDYGIINGYSDGSFKPDNPITRREAAIMISNALTICGK